MSYDHPNRVKHTFNLFDFGGAADDFLRIPMLKGKAARLWDYGVEGCVEAISGVTVTAKVAIGTTGDPDAYGEELDLNGLADNGAKSVRSTYKEEVAGFAALMVGREIAADSDPVMTLTGTTGSPTGQAVPFVIMEYQW